MNRPLLVALLLTSSLSLAACKMDAPAPAPSQAASAAGDLNSRDGLPDAGPADSEARPVMQAQVVLDRLGFTPGVVDGKIGLSTRNAISGYQEANGLPVTGEMDEVTTKALAQYQAIPATRVVTIPAEFAAGPFVDVPDDAADQAKLPALGYESLDEKLAERFHTTVETLAALNPQIVPPEASAAPSATAASDDKTPTAYFAAGQQIRVPNVGNDRVDTALVKDAAWAQTLVMLGVASTQPRAERIVVS